LIISSERRKRIQVYSVRKNDIMTGLFIIVKCYIGALPYTALIHTTIALTWFTSKCSVELNKVRCWTIHPKIALRWISSSKITERNLPELRRRMIITQNLSFDIFISHFWTPYLTKADKENLFGWIFGEIWKFLLNILPSLNPLLIGLKNISISRSIKGL
jgi:hypothetical protein